MYLKKIGMIYLLMYTSKITLTQYQADKEIKKTLHSDK